MVLLYVCSLQLFSISLRRLRMSFNVDEYDIYMEINTERQPKTIHIWLSATDALMFGVQETKED